MSLRPQNFFSNHSLLFSPSLHQASTITMSAKNPFSRLHPTPPQWFSSSRADRKYAREVKNCDPWIECAYCSQIGGCSTELLFRCPNCNTRKYCNEACRAKHAIDHVKECPRNCPSDGKKLQFPPHKAMTFWKYGIKADMKAARDINLDPLIHCMNGTCAKIGGQPGVILDVPCEQCSKAVYYCSEECRIGDTSHPFYCTMLGKTMNIAVTDALEKRETDLHDVLDDLDRKPAARTDNGDEPVVPQVGRGNVQVETVQSGGQDIDHCAQADSAKKPKKTKTYGDEPVAPQAGRGNVRVESQDIDHCALADSAKKPKKTKTYGDEPVAPQAGRGNVRVETVQSGGQDIDHCAQADSAKKPKKTKTYGDEPVAPQAGQGNVRVETVQRGGQDKHRRARRHVEEKKDEAGDRADSAKNPKNTKKRSPDKSYHVQYRGRDGIRKIADWYDLSQDSTDSDE